MPFPALKSDNFKNCENKNGENNFQELVKGIMQLI